MQTEVILENPMSHVAGSAQNPQNKQEINVSSTRLFVSIFIMEEFFKLIKQKNLISSTISS